MCRDRDLAEGAALLALVIVHAGACQPDDSRNSGLVGSHGQTAGEGGDAPSSSDDSLPGDATNPTDPAGDDATGSDPTMGELKFDTPSAGTGGLEGGHSGMGCEKVDFLFAIDNSGSMGTWQQRLADSFPAFIQTIQATLAGHDYHIMVTDGDAVASMGGVFSGCTGSPCDSWCNGCASGNVCICTCNGGAEVCEDAGASCENTHGAGEVASQTGSDCGIVGGKRYMTADQPSLESTFACAALVGIYGMAYERPVTGAIKAITNESEAGGCNEGFLRDDALLVVTLITDDPPGSTSLSQYEDAGYLMDPVGWHDAFVAAKGGVASNVVMLGILHPSLGAPVFVDFLNTFGDRGLKGDITAASYGQFFDEAVALIDTACDEFEPAG